MFEMSLFDCLFGVCLAFVLFCSDFDFDLRLSWRRELASRTFRAQIASRAADLIGGQFVLFVARAIKWPQTASFLDFLDFLEFFDFLDLDFSKGSILPSQNPIGQSSGQTRLIATRSNLC